MSIVFLLTIFFLFITNSAFLVLGFLLGRSAKGVGVVSNLKNSIREVRQKISQPDITFISPSKKLEADLFNKEIDGDNQG